MILSFDRQRQAQHKKSGALLKKHAGPNSNATNLI
jgi:hypothetical protein